MTTNLVLLLINPVVVFESKPQKIFQQKRKSRRVEFECDQMKIFDSENVCSEVNDGCARKILELIPFEFYFLK
jgi:hypothetical protein